MRTGGCAAAEFRGSCKRSRRNNTGAVHALEYCILVDSDSYACIPLLQCKGENGECLNCRHGDPAACNKCTPGYALAGTKCVEVCCMHGQHCRRSDGHAVHQSLRLVQCAATN